ncbi:MAG TPA: hypothetical protein VG742_23930 [Dongiaceae bacterium]|nr:hypothetical protein [Dongiaceae bacterium]
MAIAIAYGLMLLAGSVHFGAIGTPLGLVFFLLLAGFIDATPLHYFGILHDDGLIVAIWAAVWFGGIPALVTGLAGAALRLRLTSHALFVVLMAPVGAAITAAYLVLLGLPGREPRTFVIIIAVGALASVCCASTFGFWLPPTKDQQTPA